MPPELIRGLDPSRETETPQTNKTPLFDEKRTLSIKKFQSCQGTIAHKDVPTHHTHMLIRVFEGHNIFNFSHAKLGMGKTRALKLAVTNMLCPIETPCTVRVT